MIMVIKWLGIFKILKKLTKNQEKSKVKDNYNFASKF